MAHRKNLSQFLSFLSPPPSLFVFFLFAPFLCPMPMCASCTLGKQTTAMQSTRVHDYNFAKLHKNVLWNLFCFGSRDGAVVRALASHQCGPGSIPRLGTIYICGLSLLLVPRPCSEGFFSGYSSFFSLLKKLTLLNSNSTWNLSGAY